MKQPEQQLLGISRPTYKVGKWRGPRELEYVRMIRLWRERKAHEKRKAKS